MKNKKGLTIIELLAVIVVLAILAIITIPIISNVINDVRIKSLQNSAYGLIEAGNLYYVSKGNNTTIRFDKNDTKDTLKELSYKGIVKIGTVIIDKKGKVTVCITDGKNSAYKNYNENKVTTTKGKICSIKENSSIVYLGDDATITAYDDVKLTELVNSMQEEINALKSENETLKNKDSELESSISSLSSDLNGKITNLNTSLSSDISTLNTSLSTTNTNITNLTNRLGNFKYIGNTQGTGTLTLPSYGVYLLFPWQSGNWDNKGLYYLNITSYRYELVHLGENDSWTSIVTISVDKTNKIVTVSETSLPLHIYKVV